MQNENDDDLRAEFDRLRLEVDRIAQEAQDADGLAMMMPQGGRGIPEWVPGGGGESGLEGFWVYEGNTLLGYVTIAQALDGWDPENVNADNWSLQFAVSSNLTLVAFGTTAPVGTYETDLFDGDANLDPPTLQQYYRIPMRRQGQWICRGGVFRVNRVILSSGPKVELMRIG